MNDWQQISLKVWRNVTKNMICWYPIKFIAGYDFQLRNTLFLYYIS